MDGDLGRALLQPWALALLGACIGSFLNVVAWRLPRILERQWWGDAAALLADEDAARRLLGERKPVLAAAGVAARGIDEAVQALPPLSLARPRSACPACGHRIRWHENIPVLGWLRLRGRCSACGVRIAWRYPAVEAGVAALFFAIGWQHGPTLVALMWCAVAAVLVALALIDWDTTLLPDDLTLPLVWAGLLAAAFGASGIGLTASLAGAVAGYLSLWSVYWGFKLLTGREGMGHGDFKLLAALGAWLGWQALVPIVLMASIGGAVVGIAMKLRGALREGLYVPFGPFLAAAGLAVMLGVAPDVAGMLGLG